LSFFQVFSMRRGHFEMPTRFPDGGGSPTNASDPETWFSEAANGDSPMEDSGSRFPPNALALAILAAVKERQKDRRETDASRTQELIREARAGGQYGYEPAD
jgi:hypothetical protein